MERAVVQGQGGLTVQSTFTGPRLPLRMKMRLSSLVFVLVAAQVAAIACVVPAAAAGDAQHPISIAAAGISMEQAVKMAEQRFAARVVRAEAQQDSGHTIYVLRMLNESGRVWTVRVDASNGTVL